MMQPFSTLRLTSSWTQSWRALVLTLGGLMSSSALADTVEQLYQQAGWAQQRTHFTQALQHTQQGFKGSLPEVVYQALLENSNQRFAPDKLRQQALNTLRSQLTQADPALAFFSSPLGRKVVAAETTATSPSTLRQYQQGIPKQPLEVSRQLVLRQLGEHIPFAEAGAEVALALSSVAASSLTQMIPGVFSSAQTNDLLGSQRQHLVQQMNQDLDNTLALVYRDLSDEELEQYLAFAQSASGQAYFSAALKAVQAALH
ncbi:DUF2059 domain-containing protein [Thiopseudomonas alkaliphila]|uniref:DUF2059 domain-containing protein n=2 Tax=Thiopseudomonas alkaliphila TaxID=1697053 RepID=UPI002F410C70